MAPPPVNDADSSVFPADVNASLRANRIERRRQDAPQDPSLLFGATVFAQLVAVDLARGSVDSTEQMMTESGAGEETEDSAALAEDANGLMAAAAPSTGLLPLAAGASVIAGFPAAGGDSSSPAPRAGEASADGSTAPVADEPAPSVFARNVAAVRNGGQPSTDGAMEADPAREASDVQSAAAEAPQQFTGAGGGSPFVITPNGLAASREAFAARQEQGEARFSRFSSDEFSSRAESGGRFGTRSDSTEGQSSPTALPELPLRSLPEPVGSLSGTALSALQSVPGSSSAS